MLIKMSLEKKKQPPSEQCGTHNSQTLVNERETGDNIKLETYNRQYPL